MPPNSVYTHPHCESIPLVWPFPLHTCSLSLYPSSSSNTSFFFTLPLSVAFFLPSRELSISSNRPMTRWLVRWWSSFSLSHFYSVSLFAWPYYSANSLALPPPDTHRQPPTRYCSQHRARDPLLPFFPAFSTFFYCCFSEKKSFSFLVRTCSIAWLSCFFSFSLYPT